MQFTLADFEEMEALTGIDVLSPDMTAVKISDRMAAMEFLARRKAGTPMTLQEVKALPLEEFLVAEMSPGVAGMLGAGPKAASRPKGSRKR